MKPMLNPFKYKAIILFIVAAFVFFMFLYVSTTMEDEGDKLFSILFGIGGSILIVIAGFINLYFYKKRNQQIDELKDSNKDQENI